MEVFVCHGFLDMTRRDAEIAMGERPLYNVIEHNKQYGVKTLLGQIPRQDCSVHEWLFVFNQTLDTSFGKSYTLGLMLQRSEPQ